MTITSFYEPAISIGDGSTTEFAFPFKVFDDEDVVVKIDSSIVDSADYTVALSAPPAEGGMVTFLSPPSVGVTVSVERDMSYDQQTRYPVAGPFPAESHERALDKLTMLIQQVLQLFAGDIATVQQAAQSVRDSETVAGINAQNASNCAQTAYEQAERATSAAATVDIPDPTAGDQFDLMQISAAGEWELVKPNAGGARNRVFNSNFDLWMKPDQPYFWEAGANTTLTKVVMTGLSATMSPANEHMRLGCKMRSTTGQPSMVTSYPVADNQVAELTGGQAYSIQAMVYAPVGEAITFKAKQKNTTESIAETALGTGDGSWKLMTATVTATAQTPGLSAGDLDITILGTNPNVDIIVGQVQFERGPRTTYEEMRLSDHMAMVHSHCWSTYKAAHAMNSGSYTVRNSTTVARSVYYDQCPFGFPIISGNETRTVNIDIYSPVTATKNKVYNRTGTVDVTVGANTSANSAGLVKLELTSSLAADTIIEFDLIASSDWYEDRFL